MPPPIDPKETVVAETSPSLSDQSAPSLSADLIGTTVDDRYLVERELGRGGVGVVYFARDRKLHNKPVVVKVLLEKNLPDEWTVRKFQQEKEALARVDHPGVVGILDTGEMPDGKPYIVIQYIEGIPLRDAIRLKPEGMDLERVASIIKQIGAALSAVHEKKIYHRDLKPENIMLHALGHGEEQVKIVDFGVAKVKESVIAPSTITGAGSAGTVVYMSPEQLRGEKVTAASDIYSLGVIAYEMVTGRRPFNPDTIAHLAEMQREGLRARPSDLRPRLSKEAESLILRALAFGANERFQRAEDFGNRLAVALMSGYDISERATQDAQRPADDSPKTVAAQPEQQAVPFPSKPTLETAHVLFMDIVGYSSLLIDEQTEHLQELQEIVRNTQEFQKAQLAGQLLRLPTGDGMALSFFGDPESPVRCAVEVSRGLRDHPDIKLRMGVNSGLVYRIADINENLNISGGGINIAQRVMDCGDAGHILLSKRVADDIGQLSRWAKDLHDLGEAVVKHGARVHVYNLYSDEIGNPEVPTKVRRLDVERPKPQLKIKVWQIAAVALVLIAAVGAAILFLMRPQRTLSYSLTVQKMSGKEKVGGEYQSTGQEPNGFGNGWWYRMNVTAGQSGYLYMFNEGTVNDNVLFPTEPNAEHLAANQTIQTPWYFFDQNPGTERVWIVLSAQPLNELDRIFREATKNAGQQILTISDPAQVKTVRDTVRRYSITEPVVDSSKRQSIIKGTSDVVVSLLELEHKPQ